jgi:osmotically-inducible protein OsmY
LHIRLDGERPTIQSEERTVSKAEAPVLRVREVENGGVQVQGWDKDAYSVTACKAAVGGDAARLLAQIKLAVQGGEVSVSGPHGDREDWTVYLLIRTPRSADIEVTTHNGPVSFYTVDGKITTRATNGPISMKDCSGEANISAENGPISFSGTSGKLRLHTQNGPISVSLGANWDGSELVADAVNGPLTLRVPSGFRSSFLVESNGHGPVSCHASICADARKTWDDDHRRIEYGSGSPVIRLSTENGPISVAD